MSSLRVPKGRDVIHYYYYDPVAGRDRSKSTKQLDNKEGWIEARKIKKKWDAVIELQYSNSGFGTSTNSILLSDAFSLYRITFNNRPAKTIKALQQSFKYLYESLGEIPVNEIGRKEYNIFVNYLNSVVSKKKKLSQNSKAGYVAYVRSFFNWLILEEYTEKNPFAPLPIKRKPVEAIPADVLGTILSNLNTEQYNIIKFLSLSGFRAGEACNLKWEDINLSTGIINLHNQKVNRDDKYKMLPELEIFLSNLPYKRLGRVFRYKSSVNLRFFTRAQKRLKFNKIYTIHQIRKTFATKLIEKGVDPYDVKIMLRHRDIRTTEEWYVELNLNKVVERISKKVSV